MIRHKLYFVFTFILTFCFQNLYGQSVQRSTYSVFNSITENDTLLMAGGQIMTGESVSPIIQHGYYPLNYSLLTIDEEIQELNYLVFPNPFINSFLINWDNIEQELITIEVYSIGGSLIGRYQTNQSNIEIHLNEHASGIYYVKGYSDQGELFNEKIVKS